MLSHAQYVQIGNAVNPLLVRAVGESILVALGEGSSGAAGDTAGGASGGGSTGGEPSQQPACVPCEKLLCTSGINLLRGVTPPLEAPPPHNEAAGSTDAAAEGFGRYGEESMEERRRRVISRAPDALFCMRCVQTYTLAAGTGAGAKRKAADSCST